MMTLRRAAFSVSAALFLLDPFSISRSAGPSGPATDGLKAVGYNETQEPPREWIDPDTGHRVVRLSDEPGSQSLYFHQNAYTPDGTKLVITTPTGLAMIDLKTRAIEKVVEGRVNLIM